MGGMGRERSGSSPRHVPRDGSRSSIAVAVGTSYVACNFSAPTRRKKQPARYSACRLRKKKEEKKKKRRKHDGYLCGAALPRLPATALWDKAYNEPAHERKTLCLSGAAVPLLQNHQKSRSLAELELGTGRRSKEVYGLSWRHSFCSRYSCGSLNCCRWLVPALESKTACMCIVPFIPAVNHLRACDESRNLLPIYGIHHSFRRSTRALTSLTRSTAPH